MDTEVKSGCRVCGRRARYICGGCGVPVYCSEACARNDWENGHESACSPHRCRAFAGAGAGAGKHVGTCESTNAFGLKLFTELCSTTDKNENVCVSPFNVEHGLLMLLEGCAGRSAEQLKDAMRIGDVERARGRDLTLIQNLRGPREGLEIIVAASLWHRVLRTVRETYIGLLRESYSSDVLEITTGTAVNGWIKKNTNGLITRMLEDDPVSEGVVCMIVSAIFFRGIWKYEFDAGLTKPAVFTTAAGSETRCNMMHAGRMNVPYYEDGTLRAVGLPYMAGAFVALVVLPEPGIGPLQIASDPERFCGVTARMRLRECEIRLPRFRIEFTAKSERMIPALREMGITDIFLPGEADLSRMLIRRGSVDRILHKTVLEVTEKGTEAAAATIIIVKDASSRPELFECNRPFLFAIYTTAGGARERILFVAVINSPGIF